MAPMDVSSQPVARSGSSAAAPPRLAQYLGLVLPVLVWSMVTAWNADSVSAIQPDSQGFLEFSPMRTALYPLILRFVAWVFGSPLYAIYLQIVVAGMAALFLALSVRLWSGRWLLAFAVLIAVLANPYAATVHGQILSDSLFVSTLCLFIGVLLRMDRSPAPRYYAALSLLTGIAIALRPASFAMLALWPFVLWLYWVGQSRRALATTLVLALAPGLLVASAERLYHRSVHGPAAPSLLDLHLFAKAVAMGAVWPVGAMDADLRRAIVDFRRQTDSESARIRGFFARRQYLQEREVDAQYRFPIEPLLGAARAQGMEVHRYRRRFGLETIVAHPAAYLGLAATHYAMSWVLFTDDDPLPVHKTVVRYGIMAIGAGTLALAAIGFVLLARGTLPQCLRVPWLCSLLLHGSFLLIGLTGVYVSRYTSDYWPCMAVAVLLTARAIFDKSSNNGRGLWLRSATSRKGLPDLSGGMKRG